MGNVETRDLSTWYTGNYLTSPIHTNYGGAQGVITLGYGASLPTTTGPSLGDGYWKLIGAAQNLAYKNDLYYLYGKVDIPNRKFSYFISKGENTPHVPLHQTYKLIGNEIVFPAGYQAYLENEFRAIIKSRHWDTEK